MAVTVLLILYILSFMDRQIISLMVEPIQQDLGISDVEIGLLQGTAFAVFYTLAGLPIGWAIDRGPRRLVIFMGVLVWSLSSAGCGLAVGFWALFAGRLGVGAGEAVLSPGAYSILTDLSPRERLTRIMATYSIGANIGTAAALAFGGAVVSLLTRMGNLNAPLGLVLRPWQAAFLITGLPGVALAFLVFLIPQAERRSPPEPADRQGHRLFLDFLRTRAAALLPHFFGFSLFGLCTYVITAWAPTVMGRRFGWPAEAIGPALAVAVGLTAMSGALGIAQIADAWRSRGCADAHFRLHALAGLIGAPCAVGAFLSPSPWVMLGLLSVTCLTLGGYGGGAIASLQLITPGRYRGRTGALFLFVFSVVGLGIGPVAAGLLTEHLFADRAMIGASLALLIGVAGPLGALVLWLGAPAMRRFAEGGIDRHDG